MMPPVDIAAPVRTHRYHKQELLAEIGADGQKRLGKSSAVVIGCGALGGACAAFLARAGIGRITIVDRDFIELDNLPRQLLFDEDDIKNNLPKAVAAAIKLGKANSDIVIEPLVADVTADNIESIVEGATVVLDGTDNFETRFLINDCCIKKGIPWIYAGVVSTVGMSFAVIPGQTPCLRCIMGDIPRPGESPTCDSVGVLGTAVAAIASVEATEAIKLCAGNNGDLLGRLVSIDLWKGDWRLLAINKGENPCPVCDERRFDFLNQKGQRSVVGLCGRNAVQINPVSSAGIDLALLADRLGKIGTVSANEHILRFQIDEVEIIVFRGGRSIVKGTTDPAVARTLFARYIGM